MAWRVLDRIAIILLIIGGLNLGVVGLLNFDPLVDIFSSILVLAHTIFFLIGIAALYVGFRLSFILRALIKPVPGEKIFPQE